MKSSYSRIFAALLLCAVMAVQSCSEDDAKPDPTMQLQKIGTAYARGAATKVELHSKESLFAGYNTVVISLFDSVSGNPLTNAEVLLQPLMTMTTMTHSCPVENPQGALDGVFRGAIVFTMPSGDAGTWELEVQVDNHDNGKSGVAVLPIEVVQPTPGRLLVFQSDGGKRYYLASHFEAPLKVGVNNFEVVAFTMHSGDYVALEDLSMKLTPEMPSMDHGSPNNTDPVHNSAGHYHGKVNFTMTGEWRLSLELTDGNTPLGTRYFDVIVP